MTSTLVPNATPMKLHAILSFRVTGGVADEDRVRGGLLRACNGTLTTTVVGEDLDGSFELALPTEHPVEAWMVSVSKIKDRVVAEAGLPVEFDGVRVCYPLRSSR